jgi:hypothetical protein
MIWLFENPIPLIVIGVVIGTILLVMVYSTGQPRWLYIFGGFVLLWGGLLVVEKLVVTPREKLLATIEDGAAAVRANDWTRAATFIAPSAQKTSQQLQAQAKRYTIRELSILNRVLKFDNDSNPQTCDVGLLLKIAEAKSGYEGGAQVSLHFVWFEKEGKWLVESYEVNDRR